MLSEAWRKGRLRPEPHAGWPASSPASRDAGFHARQPSSFSSECFFKLKFGFLEQFFFIKFLSVYIKCMFI